MLGWGLVWIRRIISQYISAYSLENNFQNYCSISVVAWYILVWACERTWVHIEFTFSDTIDIYHEFSYTPCFNEVERGVSRRLSVCPSVCPSVCSSVDRIVSALYLQQYSWDPFHICTSCQATSEGVSRVMFVSKYNNLKFRQIL